MHPTTAGHAIIAQIAQSMITGPQQMAALAEAPLASSRPTSARWTTGCGRASTRRATQSKFEAWAAYDYGSSDLQAGPTNGSGHMNTIAVGVDMKVSDRMLVGAMFGYTEDKGDFGGAGGGYKLRQPVGTVYAGYGEGPWYLGATLGAGNLDYSRHRSQHSAGRRGPHRERPRPAATSTPARILGGYWFTMRRPHARPVRALSHTRRPSSSSTRKRARTALR